MIGTFLMVSTYSITVQSLKKIVLNIAGCRCENMVFVFICLSRFESGGPFVRGGYNLNRYCVTVYGSVLIFFTFFRNDCLFRSARVLIFVAK